MRHPCMIEQKLTARGRLWSQRCRGSSGLGKASCAGDQTCSVAAWHLCQVLSLNISSPHALHLEKRRRKPWVTTKKLHLFYYIPAFLPTAIWSDSVTASISTPKSPNVPPAHCWCFETQQFTPFQEVSEWVITYSYYLQYLQGCKKQTHLPRKRTISIMIIVKNTLFQNLATLPQILSWKILCHLQPPRTQTHHHTQALLALCFCCIDHSTHFYNLPPGWDEG